MKKLGGILMGVFVGVVAGTMLGTIPLYASIDFFELTTALEGGMAGLMIAGGLGGASAWKQITKGD